MQDRRLESLSDQESTAFLIDLARIQQRALDILADRQSAMAESSPASVPLTVRRIIRPSITKTQSIL